MRRPACQKCVVRGRLPIPSNYNRDRMTRLMAATEVRAKTFDLVEQVSAGVEIETSNVRSSRGPVDAG